MNDKRNNEHKTVLSSLAGRSWPLKHLRK